MPKVLVSDQYLTDIADAIRNKLEVNTTYTPAQMGPAIDSISFQNYYTGSANPTSSLGNNGDLYLQVDE